MGPQKIKLKFHQDLLTIINKARFFDTLSFRLALCVNAMI